MAGPLSYALTLDNRGFIGPMGAAKGALGGFKTAAGGTLSVLARFAAPLAAVASGAALAAGGMKTLSTASDMEQTEVGLRSLIGNMKDTTKLLKDVKGLAASTPFEFPELARSTRSLVAMDVAVGKIPTTLKRIGDVAAGVQAPISELSLLYGRAKNDGVLYTETLNQMNDRGIPVFTELAKMLGKSVPQIKSMASEGKITFPLLEQSFINLTKEGGKFHGMMQAQSQTNAGLMSTLKDAITEIMLVIGTPINDAIKPILKDAIGLVQRIGHGLTGVVEVAKAAIAQGKLGELVSMAMMIGLKEAANYGAGTFVFLGEVLFKSLETGIRIAVKLFTGGFNESIKNMALGMVNVFKGLGQIILSKLGSPFREVAAIFMAGLAKAVNFLLAELGATKLGKLLGIKVDHESYDDLLKASRELVNPGRLKEAGEANLKKGLAQAAKGFGDALKQEMEIAKEVFKGTKFEKVNLFDISKDKAAMAELATSLSPEGMKKIMEALNGSTGNLKDTAEAANKAVEKAEGFDEAVRVANTPKPQKEKKSKKKKKGKKERTPIRLYDAAESLRRRFARQSKADKGTFEDYVNKSGMNKSVIRQYAKGKNLTFDQALAQLKKGADTAGKRVSKRGKEAEQLKATESQLAVLQRIDGRMEKIAVA